MTEVLRLCGHLSMGPSGVADQSCSRIIWPRLPPPSSQSAIRAGATEGALSVAASLVSESDNLEIAGSSCRKRSPLSTNALAPTSTACWFPMMGSVWLMIMIFVSGRSRRRIRAATSPSMRGMEISISTRSGRRLLAFSTASTPSVASSQIKISVSAESKVRMLRLTRSSSSARRMRIPPLRFSVWEEPQYRCCLKAILITD